MSLSLQLTIAVLAALAVSALVLTLNLAEQPILLVLAIVVACSIVPLLGTLPARRSSRSSTTSVADGRETGEIKWFNVSKGFGFIRRQNGEEIFVHFRSIRGPHRGRRQLQDGQKVSFVVVDSDKGPQAEDVETVD